jgi:hypothetical protein
LLAGRLDERLGGRRLLTRAGEGAGAGGLRVDAEVRAVFAEGADDPATIAARLERLGVRRAGPAVSEP